MGGGQLEGFKTGHFWPSLLGCTVHRMTWLLLQPSDWMAARSPCMSYLGSDACMAVWAEPALQSAGRGVAGNLGNPLILQNFLNKLCTHPDTPQTHTQRTASGKLHYSRDIPMMCDHGTSNRMAWAARLNGSSPGQKLGKTCLFSTPLCAKTMTGACESISTICSCS